MDHTSHIENKEDVDSHHEKNNEYNQHENEYHDKHDNVPQDQHEEKQQDKHQDNHEDKRQDKHEDKHEEKTDNMNEDMHSNKHEEKADKHEEKYEDRHVDNHEDKNQDDHYNKHEEEKYEVRYVGNHEDKHQDEHYNKHEEKADKHEEKYEDRHVDNHEDKHQDEHYTYQHHIDNQTTESIYLNNDKESYVQNDNITIARCEIYKLNEEKSDTKTVDNEINKLDVDKANTKTANNETSKLNEENRDENTLHNKVIKLDEERSHTLKEKEHLTSPNEQVVYENENTVRLNNITEKGTNIEVENLKNEVEEINDRQEKQILTDNVPEVLVSNIKSEPLETKKIENKKSTEPLLDSKDFHSESTKDIHSDFPSQPEESKEELLEKQQLQNLLDKLTNLKGEGNNCYKAENWTKAEDYYRKGKDEVEIFIQDNSEKLANYTIKYKTLIEEIFKQRKFLFSNLGNTLQKQKRYLEVINIDSYVISHIDDKFDKSYIRLISTAIELKNLELANNYATLFRERFDQKTIDNYKEYFLLLDCKNKEGVDKKANINNIKDKIENLSINDDMKLQTSSSDDPNNQKIGKPKSWKWIWGPLVFAGGIGLFFLFSKRKFV